MEIWKDVKGYEGHYQVSNFGRVRSLKNGVIAIRKFSKTYCGYWQLALCKGGVCVTYRVHRLVAAAFIPNPESKEDVNHIDSNRLNNHVSNLEWATRSENLEHAARKGNVSAFYNTRVHQYDLNGNFIKEWPSLSAIDQSGVATRTTVRLQLQGVEKKCKKFIWKRAP